MNKETLFLGSSEAGIFARGLFSSMEKTAGVPTSTWDTAEPIRDYIRTISKEDRKKYCYVLVIALGAGEYYGANINADFFPWDALSHEGDDYGYRTFLRAHVYAHHVNKDPNKSFGVPVLSVLNPRMKRVELVIRLDREKARAEGADGVITRIDNGEFPDVSMGCKVPFDICTICGNKSKTKDDYCAHMRPPPEMRGIWGPNKILPDGRRICVINTLPRFFDLSFVFIGADKIAKVMAKLAQKGNHVCLGNVCALPDSNDNAVALYDAQGNLLDAGQFRKVASVECNDRRGPCGRLCAECAERDQCESDKLAAAFHHVKNAEITKVVPAAHDAMRNLPTLEAQEPDLGDDVLEELSTYPLANTLASSRILGIILKPREFQRIVLIRMGDRGFADSLDSKRQVFRGVNGFADVPMEDEVLADILRLLIPSVPSRTGYGPNFRLRLARVRAGEGSKKVLPTRDHVEHPLLDKIGEAYNGYRRRLLMKLSHAPEEVSGDPKLREQILGNELVGMFNKTSSAASIIDLNSVQYFLGAHLPNRELLSTPEVADATEGINTLLRTEQVA